MPGSGIVEFKDSIIEILTIFDSIHQNKTIELDNSADFTNFISCIQ